MTQQTTETGDTVTASYMTIQPGLAVDRTIGLGHDLYVDVTKCGQVAGIEWLGDRNRNPAALLGDVLRTLPQRLHDDGYQLALNVVDAALQERETEASDLHARRTVAGLDDPAEEAAARTWTAARAAVAVLT